MTKRYAVLKSGQDKVLVANIAESIHDFPGVQIDAVCSAGLVMANMTAKAAKDLRDHYGWLIIPAEDYQRITAAPDANKVLLEVAFALGQRIDAGRVTNWDATRDFLIQVGYHLVAERLTEDQQTALLALQTQDIMASLRPLDRQQ